MTEASPDLELGFSVGPHLVAGGLALAPMAGNTNLAYRRLCRKFGADLTTTEMVSSVALGFDDQKSLALLERGAEEYPVAAQVFGADPEALAQAAAKVETLGFHIVDLNVGCPVPKITGGGGGSALLKEPELAARCVAAMVAATSTPVTVKIRAGWDDENKNAPEFAKRMEEAGAQAVTVHGRTREQRYSGVADLNLIAEVAKAVHIPVIGNGDVECIESAKRMLETGVSGIAIGRGALGRPWLFQQIRAWLNGEAVPNDPGPATRASLLLELGCGVTELYGEFRGMRIMRRLTADFLKGLPGAAKLRARCNRLQCFADLEGLAAAYSSGESEGV
ncbi:MAG: tRNA dihydrouridine synthase DusB [Planctomycetota bacterium]|nr:MAG: tRNA dihydrouridine synthase DusB [Planctomycetota bacterium]